jgi:hypothetical protein
MIDFHPGFNFPLGVLFYVKLALYILPVNLVCLTSDCTLIIFRCIEYAPLREIEIEAEAIRLKEDPKLSISCYSSAGGGDVG